MDESTLPFNVCVTTSSIFARDIVVTAVTGPKSGGQNQATSKTMNRCSQVERVCEALFTVILSILTAVSATQVCLVMGVHSYQLGG